MAQGDSAHTPQSVRDATLDVMRAHGLTTIFANPGSTEIAFLAGLPDDFEFVLGLHEGAVVGMATGYALGRGAPAFVNLHTAPGLGNGVSALTTARVNRAPLVVVVGQQDRRHMAHEPFLTGRLDGLAGDYPVWVNQPVQAVDVPAAVARAAHEATTRRGPAIVIVPQDDWIAPYERAGTEPAAARHVVRSVAVEHSAVENLVGLFAESSSPGIVAGAGTAETRGWNALVALAEHLRCPVWQESFGGAAGFPQDHELFAGFLPAGRKRLRETLAGRDLVVAIGAPIFRQYMYEPGPFVEPGTRLAIVTDDADEAHRSPADLALLAPPAAVCELLVEELPSRPDAQPPPPRKRLPAPDPPAEGEPLRASHVLAALADRLPHDVVLMEETPSSRPELHQRLPAREPLGFVGAAMGGLGFGLSGAFGLRMAIPDRPVVAVIGDGSSLYTIQSLWSAARYGIGALIIVLSNGRYAVMDRLAAISQKSGPWPAFDLEISALARDFGCEARRIERHDELLSALDEVIPSLTDRSAPLLLEVAVATETDFAP
jgi:benzoylformate decarboxylase